MPRSGFDLDSLFSRVIASRDATPRIVAVHTTGRLLWSGEIAYIGVGPSIGSTFGELNACQIRNRL
jgi:hypothetical protein